MSMFHDLRGQRACDPDFGGQITGLTATLSSPSGRLDLF